MAHELRKYNLDKLIVNWTSSTIFHDLIEITADPAIQANLAEMRSAYLHFHSITGYADVIQTVFEQTHV